MALADAAACTLQWSMFRIVMIAGASVTTALSLGSTDFQTSVVGQLQKVFLVGLCLNLIERSSRLSQLFKTALSVFVSPSAPSTADVLTCLALFGSASLPAISVSRCSASGPRPLAGPTPNACGPLG
jgi:hypothetical protein